MAALGPPLFFGQLSGELGCVFGDEHKPYIVDVCEQLRNGWTALHRPGLQPALRKGAEKVDQDGVVPLPRVEQSLEQALVWEHIHPLVDAKIATNSTLVSCSAIAHRLNVFGI